MASRAFHHYPVKAFTLNGDPGAAEIASPADQEPSDSRERIATLSLRLHFNLLFGRAFSQGECILLADQLHPSLILFVTELYGSSFIKSKGKAELRTRANQTI